jgi:hypothetical protein
MTVENKMIELNEYLKAVKLLGPNDSIKGVKVGDQLIVTITIERKIYEYISVGDKISFKLKE